MKIHFTPKEQEALKYWRFNHPHPRVQLKMEVVWLKSLGHSQKQIFEMLDLAPNTVRSYLRDYQSGGIEALKNFCEQLPKSKLHHYIPLPLKLISLKILLLPFEKLLPVFMN